MLNWRFSKLVTQKLVHTFRNLKEADMIYSKMHCLLVMS